MTWDCPLCQETYVSRNSIDQHLRFLNLNHNSMYFCRYLWRIYELDLFLKLTLQCLIDGGARISVPGCDFSEFL